MRQRTDSNGILITTPTRDDILALKVGDQAPDCFGKMARDTSIFAQKDDVHGKAFVCYYTAWGSNATMSHSIKEDETVATIPLVSHYHRSDSVRA